MKYFSLFTKHNSSFFSYLVSELRVALDMVVSWTKQEEQGPRQKLILDVIVLQRNRKNKALEVLFSLVILSCPKPLELCYTLVTIETVIPSLHIWNATVTNIGGNKFCPNSVIT